MSGHPELKPIVVRFHKNGMFVIEDPSGTLHVLDAHKTLRDAAKYIWREESLAGLRVEGEELSFKDYKDVKFVKLFEENKDRLRSSNWEEDSYYDE